MDIVEDAWQRHRRWSKVAGESRRSLTRWRSRNLGLIVSGAVLGALAAQNEWFPRRVTITLGVLGAAALAAAGVVQNQMLSRDKVRTWAESRAASESLKGIVYQYLAKVAPFDGRDRDNQLAAKVDAVQDLAKSHLQLAMTTEPDETPVPDVTGIDDYMKKRAEQQADWHTRRIPYHERLGRRWRNAELLATGSAAVLAAVGGALHGPDLSAWVAVATTAGAAVAAHIASEQHDRVAAGYASTTEELQRLCRNFRRDEPTPEAAAQFVAAVERVLATQNESWASLISLS
jgi:hypothetical protein